MRHLLDIESLSPEQIIHLINRAQALKSLPQRPTCPQEVAMLFFEHSTRTRLSFEMAAHRLGQNLLHLDGLKSSEQKEDPILDTLKMLEAMGVRVCIIRHPKEGVPHRMASQLQHLSIINAGDGRHAHPTQALLDMMTILQYKSTPHALKITLIGDIRHSRVAQSWQWMASKMGVGELCMVAPALWQPEACHFGHVTASIQEGLDNADVIICLRTQNDRLNAAEQLDRTSFQDRYALTAERLQFAKPDAIVLHPGPVNRGIEIESAVVERHHSVIQSQIENGVFMRMAILEAIALGKSTP